MYCVSSYFSLYLNVLKKAHNGALAILKKKTRPEDQQFEQFD